MSEWIWRGNFCKWELLVRDGMRIIHQGKNMMDQFRQIKKAFRERTDARNFPKFDDEKAESAKIFQKVYYKAKNDEVYQKLMKEHKEKYESGD